MQLLAPSPLVGEGRGEGVPTALLPNNDEAGIQLYTDANKSDAMKMCAFCEALICSRKTDND